MGFNPTFNAPTHQPETFDQYLKGLTDDEVNRIINADPRARVLARVEAWRDLKAMPNVNLNKLAFMRIYATQIEPRRG